MWHPCKTDTTGFIPTTTGVLCHQYIAHLERKSHVRLQLPRLQLTQLGYPVKYRYGFRVPPPRVRLVVCVLRASKVLVVHNHFRALLGEDEAVWTMRVRDLQASGDVYGWQCEIPEHA